MDALKAKGQLENTIIFYLQDNGACAEELNWVAERPDEADFIAQSDQLGGGESDEVNKLTTTEVTPFPDQTLNEVTKPPEMEIQQQKVYAWEL